MRSLAISLLLFLLLPLSTFATPSADDRLIDQLMAVRQFSGVDISPDGTRVAWARTGGGISTANVPNGAPHALAGSGEQLAPQFSPDSRSLAYLQEAKGGQRQLYVVRGTGAPRKLRAERSGNRARNVATADQTVLFSGRVCELVKDHVAPPGKRLQQASGGVVWAKLARAEALALREKTSSRTPEISARLRPR